MIAARLSTARPALRACAFAARPVVHAKANTTAVRAAEEAVDNAFVYGEDESAAAAPSSADDTPLPTYHLNVLYLEKCVGIAVDQKLASGEKGPVTEYFMWPAKDAWEQLKQALEAMTWISTNDTILLLNSATQVINYWQSEETKHTIDDAKVEFPDITFFGA